MMSRLKVSVLLLASSSMVLLDGCGWKETGVLRSPRHDVLLRLRQPPVFPQAALEVVVERGAHVIYQWKAPGHEYFLYFVQDYWSEDGSVCGLYATGTNTVEFAFDLKAQVPVSFASIAGEVAAQIAHTYGVDHDQLGWARLSDASQAFSRRCQLRGICLNQ